MSTPLALTPHTKQTLDFVEGVFASKVLNLAFCLASTDDAIHDGEAISGPNRLACAKDAKRLVCAGYNADGTIAIKGLAASSLAEKFSFCLIEAPTCLRIATRRPTLAIGFADGALNIVNFGEDRYCDVVLPGREGCLGMGFACFAFSPNFTPPHLPPGWLVNFGGRKTSEDEQRTKHSKAPVCGYSPLPDYFLQGSRPREQCPDQHTLRKNKHNCLQHALPLHGYG